jgi:two-component system nitrogen regulation sensor histidine kinase NtrY
VSRRFLRTQDRIFLWVLGAGTPAWLVTAVFLWNWEAAPAIRWGLFSIATFGLVAGAILVRRQVVRPLQSLANMLEALREGDYSIRGRNVDPEDAVGEVMIEVNSLSGTLHDQRLEALEAGVLLQKVIADVDIGVFAFDAERRLRLVNRAGASLLGGDRDLLRGRTAEELGLTTMLEGPSGRIVSHDFPGGSGRWEVRRRQVREGGRPHELLVITDVSRALREEERRAWQKLVRVIGHELNSSLTPIKSMAGTIRKLIDQAPLPEDLQKDASAGLEIIHDRADALGRFMGAYARLARLPLPARQSTDFATLADRAASLFDGRVTIESNEAVTLDIDSDQIEQVLINLIKNAIEAMGETGAVRIRWRTAQDDLVVEVEDDGPGLARTDNLWVPFFTTKPGGTGLGLVLCRDIVENHNGAIALENRRCCRGCVARVRLPLGKEG